MRVLVTGGAGFIGSHIVDLLVQHGAHVAVVDNLSRGVKDRLPEGVSFYQVGIESPRLHEVFAEIRPEYVIHQAAQVDVRRSVKDPEADAWINILGSIRLLECCRRFGVRKVVYASSAAVYGDPVQVPVDEDHPILATSAYGVSKHTVEHYLFVYRALYGIDYAALRYSNVYGPRQDPSGDGGVVAIFAHRIVRGEPVTIYGDGEQTRDLVYVEDVARANLLALTRGEGVVVNVSCGRETSVNALFRMLKEAAGSASRAEHAPERPGEIRRSCLANRKAQELLGWKPEVSLEEGLERTVAYARSARG